MRTTINPLFVLVLVSQIFGSAKGFDATGHMIVQEIALSQLNQQAKQNIDALVTELRATPDNSLYDQVSISCWPDDIRYHQLHDFQTWHYIDLGLNGEGPPIPMNVGDLNNEDGNIVIALKRVVAVLKGGNDPLIKTKPVALALLCHLVGDIHQPLHCVAHYFPNGHREGNSETDQGGNLVKLKNAKVVGLSLHAFWDSAYRATFVQNVGEVDLESDRIDTASYLEGDPSKRIIKHDYRNITERVHEVDAIDVGHVGTDLNFEA